MLVTEDHVGGEGSCWWERIMLSVEDSKFSRTMICVRGKLVFCAEGQGQGQGQDHEKVRQRGAQLQLRMVLALTLVLVLTLALAPSGMISKKGVPHFCPSTVALLHCNNDYIIMTSCIGLKT